MQTAGEIQNKLNQDVTIYDQMEVAFASLEGYTEELQKCALSNNPIFEAVGLDDYCIVAPLVKDPLLVNVVRRKFYAWPCMPQPRPNQTVFYYNWRLDKLTRLWVLPNAATMAYISELAVVAPRYQTMQEWSDAFFAHKLWSFVKSQHTLPLYQDRDFEALHGEKFRKLLLQMEAPLDTETPDDGKISFDEIVDTVKAVSC